MKENQTEFYSALWGESTLLKSIWYGAKGKSPTKCAWFTDTTKAIDFANTLAASNQNVYHACSLYSKKRRIQSNVGELRAIWLDLDLKDSDCVTLRDMAIKYLPMYEKFILGSNFWVLKTGGGFHVYWMLDTPVTQDVWKNLANKLHEFNVKHKIPADPSRTRDSASLLRVPGTFNLKSAPVEVVVLRKAPTVTVPKVALPTKKSTKLSVSKLSKKRADDFDINMQAMNLSGIKSDVRKVAQKCQVIKSFEETALEGNEPLRYKAISVVRLCEDGRKHVHAFCAKHSRYSEDWVDKKISQLETKEIGPSLCTSFIELGACEGCPHVGKVSSPIQLGTVVEPITKPLDNIINFKAKERARELIALAPKNNWMIGKTGIYRIIDEIPVLVSKVPFFIIDKFSEDTNDASIITILIRAYTPLGIVDFRISLKHMADDRKIMSEFNGRSIFPVNSKHFKEYIKVYCDCLAHISPHKASKSLGWQPDGSFLYSSTGEGISPDGKRVTSILDYKAASYIAGYTSKGSIEQWRKAVEIYERSPSFKPHLFSMLCSLGAPLLNFTSAKGFVLSLQGSSGSGKTLSHLFAMSVWGDPQIAGCLGTKDTNTSMLGRLGAIKNLPLRMDEATTLDTKALSNLIYELVNGRGRARATIDGSLSGSSTEWNTVTLITTNRPLLEHKITDISEAARYRILEIEAHMPPSIMTSGKKIGLILENNYGVCGKPFIEYVVKNQQEIIEHINYFFDKFSPLVAGDKRFWVACGAVAFTAAVIGIKLNLFKINLEKLFLWFSHIIRTQTQLNDSILSQMRGFDTLEEFMFAMKDYLAPHTMYVDDNGNELRTPPREVKAKLQITREGEHLFYVRSPAFTEFVRIHFTESVVSIRKQFGIPDSKPVRDGDIVGRFYVFLLRRSNDSTY